mmetsp:Transcript_11329/g.38744  ORF Transcript_11329/g.38744 Transcript_11329/m.38744 type:complete len:146 (-) Transcript_11329:409-846(-)
MNFARGADKIKVISLIDKLFPRLVFHLVSSGKEKTCNGSDCVSIQTVETDQVLRHANRWDISNNTNMRSNSTSARMQYPISIDEDDLRKKSRFVSSYLLDHLDKWRRLPEFRETRPMSEEAHLKARNPLMYGRSILTDFLFSYKT